MRSFQELLYEIESVFQVYPSTLGIMRLDLAVDVIGVPVSLFQDCLRAAYKRMVSDFENAEQFVRMGQRDVETIYLGKRPNCFRIYNKIAEFKTQYAKLQKQLPEAPEFQDLYVDIAPRALWLPALSGNMAEAAFLKKFQRLRFFARMLKR